MKKIILALIFFIYAFSDETSNLKVENIKIQNNIERAFGASPPPTAMLYMLAPEKMIAKNYDFLDIEKQFMLPKIANLPTLGGFFGSGGGINTEKLLALKPQVVFMWDVMKNAASNFEKDLEKFGISVVYLKQDSIESLINSIELMGDILGVQERANKLISIGRKNIAEVQAVAAKQTQKPRLYYAHGIDGLYSVCDTDTSFDVAKIAGASNVYKCKEFKSRPRITLERLYEYDPDIIIVREKSFFEELKDPKSTWRNLKAYKNANIFLEPSSPYSFLHRPPTPMRFLGIVWLCKVLYKDKCELDLKAKTKEFYRDFLNVELNDEDIPKLYKSFKEKN